MYLGIYMYYIHVLCIGMTIFYNQITKRDELKDSKNKIIIKYISYPHLINVCIEVLPHIPQIYTIMI